MPINARMTAVEIFESLRWIPREIERKRAEITALDAIVDKVTATWSDMPRASVQDYQKKERAIADANGLKTEIIDNAIVYVEMLKTAINILAVMPDRKYALMLNCVYLNCMTEASTAELLGVCDKTIRRWMEPAFEQAEKAYRKYYSECPCLSARP